MFNLYIGGVARRPPRVPALELAPCASRLLPPLAAFFSLPPSPLAARRQRAHAAETPAYIALGDSLAFGVGAANPAAEGYVALALR